MAEEANEFEQSIIDAIEDNNNDNEVQIPLDPRLNDHIMQLVEGTNYVWAWFEVDEEDEESGVGMNPSHFDEYVESMVGGIARMFEDGLTVEQVLEFDFEQTYNYVSKNSAE